MPLFLAGLLVRGGVLAPEQAEEALQRQALLGGALDTSLLELGSIDEAELASYLSRASGFPVPPPGALTGPLDPALRELVAPKKAERHGVVPFAEEAGVVHVACSHPVEGTPVDELAPGAKGIVAHIAPEVRVRLAIERLYGIPAAMRFHDLERRLASPGAEATASEPAGSVEEAYTLLGSAADRDDALAVLLRFARQRFELVAALAVSGRTLVGWDALGPDPEVAARVKGVSLSVNEPSVLRLVLESGGPYLGPMAEADPARNLEITLGRQVPHVVLVVPIVVAKRTVALLFAENGARAIGPAHVEQVMHVAQAVGPALEKLIRARKNGAPAAPSASAFRAPASVSSPSTTSAPAAPAPGVRAKIAGHPAPVREAAPLSTARAPTPPVPTAPVGAEASSSTLPAPAPAAETLRLPKVERRRPKAAESPLEPARIAVERALATRSNVELEEVLPALREVAELATQLLVSLLPADPAASREPPKAVRVLIALGERALPALAAAAVSPSRGIRLHAARIAAASRAPQAAALLAALASDEDAEVAAVAARGQPYAVR